MYTVHIGTHFKACSVLLVYFLAGTHKQPILLANLHVSWRGGAFEACDKSYQ